MQTVDELPWELEETIKAFMERLDNLATDLAEGKSNRMFDPDPRSNGKRIPAFEFLSKHRNELESGKLSLVDPRDDDKVLSVDLVLSSERRRSASIAVQLGAGSGAAMPTSPKEEVLATMKELSKLCKFMSETLTIRLTPPEGDVQQFRRMAAVLDFRKMAVDPEYCSERKKPVFKLLYDLMESRFSEVDTVPVAPDMPALDIVWEEFVTLCRRMCEAFKQRTFKQRWEGASGTVIKVDIFTNPRFYEGCKNYLYLWLHMATKTMNEAVVEGMGSVWDAAADVKRHPSFDTGVQEAVIAWSAQQPWHPEAKPFLNKSLNLLFKGGQWNFFHRDVRERGKVSL